MDTKAVHITGVIILLHPGQLDLPMYERCNWQVQSKHIWNLVKNGKTKEKKLIFSLIAFFIMSVFQLTNHEEY